MLYDPTDRSDPFWQLFQEVQQCKEKHPCAYLNKRAYYWEPNSFTVDDWRKAHLYLGDIDRRVVFVCESPGGPRPQDLRPTTPRRCWAGKGFRDKRFEEVRKENGFQDCYITNSVKCGVRQRDRQGAVHTDDEINGCISFLLRELELIQPLVVVGVGANAAAILRKWCLPRMKIRPALFRVTHYSARGRTIDLWEKWKQEFQALKGLLSRLERRSE